MNEEQAAQFKEWITEKWGASKLPWGGAVPFPATSKMFHTGDWRTERPLVSMEKCTGCTKCYFICPDDAIRLNDEFKPLFNYDFCKGCTLCNEICPRDAIYFEPEVQI